MNHSDFLPPILVKLARRTRQSRDVFASYDEALLHCGANAYENPTVADVVFQKTVSLVSGTSSSPYLIDGATQLNPVLGLTAARYVPYAKSVLNVVDIGGACGAHFAYAQRALRDCRLRWCVVETKTMAARAQPLVTQDLMFVSTFNDALKWLGHIDLLYSSYALPYFPDPMGTLRELTSLGAHVMMFARLPLTEGEAYTVIQTSRLSANGPGPLPTGTTDGLINYPATFMNRGSFERLLSQQYSTIAQYWDKSGDANTPRESIKGRCYLVIQNNILEAK